MKLNKQFTDLEDAVTRFAYADYLEERDEEPDFRDHLRGELDDIRRFLVKLENIKPWSTHLDTDESPFQRWWIRDIIYGYTEQQIITLFAQLWDNRYAYIFVDIFSSKGIIKVDYDYHRLKINHLISDEANNEYVEKVRPLYPNAEIIDISCRDHLNEHNECVEDVMRYSNHPGGDIVRNGVIKIGDFYYHAKSFYLIPLGKWVEVTDVSSPRHVCNFYCVRRLTPTYGHR